MSSQRDEADDVDEPETLDPGGEVENEEATESMTPGTILRGIGKTAAHMLSKARAETRLAQGEAWERYAELTKHRRDKD